MRMTERYLIIGLGSIGRRHLTNLRKLRPQAKIAVLRSRAVAEKENCPPEADEQFDQWSDALAFAPSAAIIANPASHHVEAAQKLLSAGIPMLIEKPLADSLKDLPELVQALAMKRLPALLAYCLRLFPSLVQSRRLIKEGAIGDVLAVRAEVGQYLPDWRPQSRYQDGVSANRRLGGGPLLELSHEFDYLYWVFGLPHSVTAKGGKFSNLEIDVEDAVEVVLDYGPGKMLVNVHLDFLQRSVDRRCRFIGSEGTLIWNAIQNEIELYRASTKKWERLTFSPDDRVQIYIDELNQFFGFIEGAPTDLARVAEGYDVLAVVDAAVQSMKLQQTVKVDGYAQRIG
jgi:predicted dehydrogenase